MISCFLIFLTKFSSNIIQNSYETPKMSKNKTILIPSRNFPLNECTTELLKNNFTRSTLKSKLYVYFYLTPIKYKHKNYNRNEINM